MSQISLKDLIKATVHIGHIKSKWIPAMAPYIWGSKNNIHLIDVAKTAHQLEKAGAFLESLAAQNKPILWVGTKKPAQEIVKTHAVNLKSPFVTYRWIGGTLTNFAQVKKSVTKLLHYEDIATKADDYLYTKKEINKFQKLADRLRKNVGGIRKLQWPVGALVVIDVKKEQAAIKEAIAAGVPVVAMVDTNSDPSGVTYVIPANDDAPRSIAFIVDYLASAVARGQEKVVKVEVDEAPIKVERRPEIIITQTDEEEAAEVAKKPVVKAAAVKRAPKKMVEAASPEADVKPVRSVVKKPVKE